MSENPKLHEENAPSFLSEIVGLLKTNISQYFMFIALIVIMIFLLLLKKQFCCTCLDTSPRLQTVPRVGGVVT